ncbi:MAG TPA: hypothetical protein VM737_03845 [Gemmatimonadota bacterium]|nr:hypothetical protein [Gemmatimonadota bacterium]
MSGTETDALWAYPDTPGAVPRVCLIAPDGPMITVRMAVEIGLKAAGRFWLLDPIYRTGRYPLLKWEMVTGEDGEAAQRLGVPPEDLGLHSLSFAIDALATVPTADEGTIRIRVFQGRDECTILPPAVFPREFLSGRNAKIDPDWLHNGFVFTHRG